LYKVFLFLTYLFLLGCAENQESMRQPDVVLELFRHKANQHGFRIDSVSGNDIVFLSKGEETSRISLTNARRSYKTNGDTVKVDELVNVLLHLADKLPSWAEAQLTLLPVLVPADMQDVDSAIHKVVTDSISVVLVQNLIDQIVWVQPDHAAEWKQNEDALFEVAYANLAAELKKAKIKPAILEGHPYGIVLAKESYLDSSMPLSPAFKKKVQKQFGWPVYAIMPVRDLCFIFSQNEFDFFSKRFASTVLAEFNESPYPVSRELLKISDEGIRAIGHYAPDGK
jgi:hypothetical protein